MFLERGWEFTHESVREWERRFAPLIAQQLRTKRRGQAGPSRYVDETYVKVKGRWCYLYRAIDTGGNLVDSRAPREARYGGCPTVFQTRSRRCWPCSGTGNNGRSRLLSASSARNVGRYRASSNPKYLNNRLEQDHRGIKQRYYPMHGARKLRLGSAFLLCL
jgi:putative transposase